MYKANCNFEKYFLQAVFKVVLFSILYILDVETSSRLELVQCLRGSRPHHSLLGILNRCHSGGGTRLLRANILQPPNLQVTILERLNCVQEIVDTPELLYALKVHTLNSTIMYYH